MDSHCSWERYQEQVEASPSQLLVLPPLAPSSATGSSFGGLGGGSIEPDDEEELDDEDDVDEVALRSDGQTETASRWVLGSPPLVL